MWQLSKSSKLLVQDVPLVWYMLRSTNRILSHEPTGVNRDCHGIRIFNDASWVSSERGQLLASIHVRRIAK